MLSDVTVCVCVCVCDLPLHEIIFMSSSFLLFLVFLSVGPFI